MQELSRTSVQQYILLAANYALPLLVLPMMARALGPDGFGIMTIALAVAAYFVLLVEFGFGYSATRQVAAHRDDKDALGRLLATVMWAKAGLLASSSVVYAALVYAVPEWRASAVVFSATYLAVVGSAFSFGWFFQGLGELGPVLKATVFARLLTTAAVLLVVDDPGDVVLAASLVSGSTVLASLLSWPSVLRAVPAPLWRDAVGGWQALRKESLAAFLSTAAGSLYLNAVPIVLGIMAGNAAAGAYGVASKLTLAVMAAWVPFSQALYPKLSALYSAADKKGLKSLQSRAGLALVGAGLVGSVLLFLTGEALVSILFGPQYASAVPVLEVLALAPVLVAGSNFLGVQVLFVRGRFRAPAVLQACLAVASLAWLVPLVDAYSAVGAAVSVCVTEFLVTFGYLVLVSAFAMRRS